VSRYQKGKTNLDFTEARDSEWQWHQLVHIQVCISLQTDNHAWSYCRISFDYDDYRKFLYFYLCNLTPKILIWNKYASTRPLKFFRGRMPFMPPNQQRKSNEGIAFLYYYYGLFSRTTWVSWYQKGKTNLDFTGERDSEWQWHQLGHMQVCTFLQTDNHANTPPLVFLQAGCPSCCPTNSVKALKGQ